MNLLLVFCLLHLQDSCKEEIPLLNWKKLNVNFPKSFLFSKWQLNFFKTTTAYILKSFNFMEKSMIRIHTYFFSKIKAISHIPNYLHIKYDTKILRSFTWFHVNIEYSITNHNHKPPLKVASIYTNLALPFIQNRRNKSRILAHRIQPSK